MISIIIPVYKVEKYIRRCIESVLSQTYNDWELLLIDDGSPDMSGAICDEYEKKDSRIRVFHKENGGVSSARNYGINKAEGEWLVFIDSDDWIEDGYLLEFFNNAPSNDVLLIQGRYNDKSDGTNIDTIVFKSESYSVNDKVKGIVENQLLFHGAPYCKLYNKDIVINRRILFPENYSYGEDTYFFLRYLKSVKGIRLLPATGYHYIHYEGSNLSNKLHKPEHLLSFLKDSFEAVSEIDDSKGSLQKEYMVSSISLLKKTVISLYSLDYNRAEKIIMLDELKRICHPLLKVKANKQIKDIILLQWLVFTPLSIINSVLSLHYKH